MGTGAITGYVDVAQLVLYAVLDLLRRPDLLPHRENKREGYPLAQTAATARGRGAGLPGRCPTPKTYMLAARRRSADVPTRRAAAGRGRAGRSPATPARRWSPPAIRCSTASGPASYAPTRADMPDLTSHGDAAHRAAARRAPATASRSRDPDPRGMPVIGADGEVGGTVRDLWVDRSEALFRYLEVEVRSGATAHAACCCRCNFAAIQARRTSQVRVDPRPPVRRRAGHCASPDQVTLLEEDKIWPTTAPARCTPRRPLGAAAVNARRTPAHATAANTSSSRAGLPEPCRPASAALAGRARLALAGTTRLPRAQARRSTSR